MSNSEIEAANKAQEAEVNVFISYRSHDFELARILRDGLIELSAEKIQPFFSEDMTFGKKWEDWIRESIVKSHVLVLLFTDQNENWKWCLFEAGLFLGCDLSAKASRSVVCIYQPNNKPPAQLMSIQGVEATKENITKFFYQLFCETEVTKAAKPVSLALRPPSTRLPELAERLSAFFEVRATTSNPLTPEVVFQITKPGSLEKSGIPDETVVTLNNPAFDLFEILQRSDAWTWGKLRNAVKSESTSWYDDLSRAMLQASAGKKPDPITATFRIWGSGKIFRPLLYQIEEVAGQFVKFYVLLNQERIPSDLGGPRRSGRIFNTLRVSARTRYEIIEHFLKQLRSGQLPDGRSVADYEAVFRNQIRDSLLTVENDQKDSRISNPEEFLDLFDAEDQTRLQDFSNSAAEQSSKLRDALDKGDLAAIKERLERMRESNKEAHSYYARLYSKLIDEENRSPQAAGAPIEPSRRPPQHAQTDEGCPISSLPGPERNPQVDPGS